MKSLTPAEFVPMWMENHRIGPGAASDHDIVQMLKDYMSDIDSPVRILVDRIYQDPEMQKGALAFSTNLEAAFRQTFMNGYCSVRDLEEFQRLAKLTKLS